MFDLENFMICYTISWLKYKIYETRIITAGGES